MEELRYPLMSHSEFTRRCRYAALVPFQCLQNKPRLKMIDLFFEGSPYQSFFNAGRLFEFVHHYSTTDSQTLEL